MSATSRPICPYTIGCSWGLAGWASSCSGRRWQGDVCGRGTRRQARCGTSRVESANQGQLTKEPPARQSSRDVSAPNRNRVGRSGRSRRHMVEVRSVSSVAGHCGSGERDWNPTEMHIRPRARGPASAHLAEGLVPAAPDVPSAFLTPPRRCSPPPRGRPR
jgi:hypothetical protein